MALVIKNLSANAGDIRASGSIPGSERFPWRRAWQPTPVFLSGESRGQMSLESSYSPVSQFSHSAVSDSLRPQELQHTRLAYSSLSPGVCSNSCPSSWWFHPTISSSFVPFPSWLQSFPAAKSCPMRQFFTSGGQIIGVLASASVLPMNIQYWFLWGFTGLISLQSKVLSRVCSNTTVQKHQYFSAQLSLWSNSYTHTWLLEKP